MKCLKVLLVIFFLFSKGQTQAQFNIDWIEDYQHTSSPSFSNEGKKIAIDPFGNIIILADVSSDIDPTGFHNPVTQYYTVLRKYSPSGTLIASRQINVPNQISIGYDHVSSYGLEIDNLGNIFIGYNDFSTSTGFDAVIAKYNNNLIRQWATGFNPVSDDQGIDLKINASGIVYALVKSVNGANTRYHIIKGDSLNQVSTAAFYDFNLNTEVIKSIVVADNNAVSATGFRLIGGFQNIITVQINSNGTLRWMKLYNGGSTNRNDIGNKILLGPNQALYVVGTSDRSAPFLNDGVVIKYFATNGKEEWVVLLDYNNGNEEGVTAVVGTPNKLFVGSTRGNSVVIDRIETDRGTVSGKHLYTPLPDEQHQTINGIFLSCMKLSPNNNIYLSGTLAATDLNGNDFSAQYLSKFVQVAGRVQINDAFRKEPTISVIGNFLKSTRASDLAINYTTSTVFLLGDMFEDYSNHSIETVKLYSYDAPVPMRLNTSSIDLSDDPFKIKIYPNPAINSIDVYTGETVQKFIIADLTGKIVRINDVSFTEIYNYDVSDLPSGLYTVTVHYLSGKIQTQKLIISE